MKRRVERRGKGGRWREEGEEEGGEEREGREMEGGAI